MLVGRWSTKISHSAMPRNRSSRNSRSPVTGSVIAGAAALSPAAVLLSLRDVPATGSAMDDIWHRWFGIYACTARDKDHIGPQPAHKIRKQRRDRTARGGALEWNYVESAIKRPSIASDRRLFPRHSWL